MDYKNAKFYGGSLGILWGWVDMSWQLVSILIVGWIMFYDKITGVTAVIICYYCFRLSFDLEIVFSLYWLYIF